MMPIHLAEHDVAGEHHQLRRRPAFAGDGQTVGVFIENRRLHQPPAVEIPSVRHAAVQAVPIEIVHLVDVDRPGEHPANQSQRRRIRPPREHIQNLGGPDVPMAFADLGQLAMRR